MSGMRQERAGRTIRKNDVVQVLAGKETGKRGKVLTILAERGRVLVEKVNLVKKHQKPTQKQRQGGIVEKEASLHISNVMIVCEKCNRPVRVRIQKSQGAGERRTCGKCGNLLERKTA